MRKLKIQGRVTAPSVWVRTEIYADKVTRFQLDPTTIGLFTGRKDKNGRDIYEGDIIGEWNVIDGKKELSKLQVFWCDENSAFMVDISFSQDRSTAELLSETLENSEYAIVGNIHGNSNWKRL